MPPPAKALVILPKAKLSLQAAKPAATATPAAASSAPVKTPSSYKEWNKVKGLTGDKKKQNKKAAQKAWWQEEVLAHESPKPLVSADTPWHVQSADVLAKVSSMSSGQNCGITPAQLDVLEPKLERLYKSEVDKHASFVKSSSSSSATGNVDEKWMKSVIESGTWSDKIAALALKVQESPFHSLESLDLLLGIATNKDLRTSGLAVEALKDLFINNLLPDRPLHALTHQLPFQHAEFSPRHALLLWFESRLRTRYAHFLDLLDRSLRANLPYFRKQSIATTLELLSSHPEQEQRLLCALVNKLGDSDGPVRCAASDALQTLTRTHPRMKGVLVYEVRMLLQRCHKDLSQVFSAVTFLNTVSVHGRQDEDVAVALAECFLGLFEMALQAKEKGSRLLSALLKGINRVFPKISKLGDLVRHVDTIFRLAHTATSQAASTQALVLLSQIAFHSEDKDGAGGGAQGDIANRFYSALYARLWADQILKQVHNTAFLNLLFVSMKRDTCLARTRAFIKRILMAAPHAPPPLSAGLLLIVSEVFAHRPALVDMAASTEAATSSGEEGPLSEALGEEDEEEGEGGGEGEAGAAGGEAARFGPFDADKRDPRFACASPPPTAPHGPVPVLFELSLLAHHVHPSVSAFARALLEPPAHGIAYDGDPLEDFSLSSFLDRLAFKHPKQRVADRLRAHRHAPSADAQPMYEEFAGAEGRAAGAVAPEKHFFHKFFAERGRLLAEGRMRQRQRRRGRGEGDADSDASGEDEAEPGEDDDLDAFADQLARGLVRSSAHNDGDEGDDWDEDGEGEGDGDGEGEGEGDSEEGDWDAADEAVDLDAFRQARRRGGQPSPEASEDDDGDDEDMPEVYQSEEEEEEVEEEVEEEEEEEEEVPRGGPGLAAAGGRKRAARSDFADAADFEDEMEAIVSAHSVERLADPRAVGKQGTLRKPSPALVDPPGLRKKRRRH